MKVSVPIVFCRFMDTADYVARELRKALPDRIRVESVTGILPPAEREARIGALTKDGGEYMLVCTDCLSEGVNLQHSFSAVIHYDLAGIPRGTSSARGASTGLARSGKTFRSSRISAKDNPIDGVILDVLIRKHKSIKNDLGVMVAVPGSSEQIAETLFEGALFREMAGAGRAAQLGLDFGDEGAGLVKTFHDEWDAERDREKKRRRSRFAQDALDKDAVAAELASVREAIGGTEDVGPFLARRIQVGRVPVNERLGAIVLCRLRWRRHGRCVKRSAGWRSSLADSNGHSATMTCISVARAPSSRAWRAGCWIRRSTASLATASRPPPALALFRRLSLSVRTTLIVARFRYQLTPPGREADDDSVRRDHAARLPRLGRWPSVAGGC